MKVNTELTEERIRSAHKTAPYSTQRVLQELWPWLKDRPFKAGTVVICNDGFRATVIGYSDDPVALRYFRSLAHAPSGELGLKLLAMTVGGRPKWSKEEYFCLPGGIFDHG